MSRLVGSLVLVAVLAALAATSGSYGASAAPAQKARILDRTLLCTVEPTGGIYELNVYGQSGVRLQEDPSKWKSLPSAHLNSGSIWKVGLAGATAGRSDELRSGMWYDPKRCKRTTTKRRPALSTKGLSGGRANQWEERFECVVPRQFLIRVRAQYSGPTDWDSLSSVGLITAGGPPLLLAQLAAATRTGTALAYVDVNESGRTRLFYRGNCVRGTA